MRKFEKVVSIILLIGIAVGISLIIYNSIPNEEISDAIIEERFMEIERYSYSSLYYDVETKVIYYGNIDNTYSFLTPVYNSDGTLQIYPN